MTREEKQLILTDSYARLSYGFKLYRESDGCIITIKPNDISTFAHFLEYSKNEDFKLYLRSMSSMTEDEFNELATITELQYDQLELMDWGNDKTLEFYLSEVPQYCVIKVFDWLNKKQFDYRGMIAMGLALEIHKV
jgi:hypothetical protein